MNLQEKIKELATPERARQYEATQDKYLFALDTLRHELDLTLNINYDRTDQIVESFEIALEAAAPKPNLTETKTMTKQDLIKTIKEISEKIDAQRSALEDLENDMREIDLWNDEIDIDGEINQAAAEAEAITDNLAKVIEAIRSPETEIEGLESVS